MRVNGKGEMQESYKKRKNVHVPLSIPPRLPRIPNNEAAQITPAFFCASEVFGEILALPYDAVVSMDAKGIGEIAIRNSKNYPRCNVIASSG